MTEAEIWQHLKSGDKKALEQIYRLYFADLYDYGKKFTVDGPSVEDCIQELFVDIWNKRENLSQISAIRPYLFISLKRKIIRLVSKLRNFSEKELENEYFETELSIEEIMIHDETGKMKNKKLQAAFEKISSRQKEILYLRYYSDLDYEAIGEIMDLNYQSARNLMARAIQKLSSSFNILISIMIMGIKNIIQ